MAEMATLTSDPRGVKTTAGFFLFLGIQTKFDPREREQTFLYECVIPIYFHFVVVILLNVTMHVGPDGNGPETSSRSRGTCWGF